MGVIFNNRAPQAERPGNELDIQHNYFSSMLMALRFVLARLCSVRRLLIVPAATTAATTTAMPAVAKQMHADKQDENHDPYPVLR